MSIKISFKDEDGYLNVHASGQWDLKSKNKIDIIRDEADRRGFNKIFLDIRDISKPETEMIRFETGKEMAKVWKQRFRVAILGRHEMINRFAETVAKNRGALVTIFTEESEALEWLQES